MTHLTLQMLELLVRLRKQPRGSLPVHQVSRGTASALVQRDLCRWEQDSAGEFERLALTPRGRRHVDAARSLKLPRRAA